MQTIGRGIVGCVNQVQKPLIEISAEGRLPRGTGQIMTRPDVMEIGILPEIRIASVQILGVTFEPYFQV
jgi:hypothetical protein